MYRIAVVLAFAAVSVAPLHSSAQEAPGQGVTVTVDVVRMQRRGDTTSIGYRIRNAPESREELWTFTVEAPSPAVSISRPLPASRWSITNRWGDLPIARWAMLDPLLAPGEETPLLEYAAIGLPGMVVYYAGGDWPVPAYTPLEGAPVRVNPRESLAAVAVRGITVGVQPVPENLQPVALNERLRTLQTRACALGWITSQGVCHSLEVKLENAAKHLERGQLAPARNILGAYLAELEAQHGPQPGKHVNDSAYWLLKTNVEFILSRM